MSKCLFEHQGRDSLAILGCVTVECPDHELKNFTYYTCITAYSEARLNKGEPTLQRFRVYGFRARGCKGLGF